MRFGDDEGRQRSPGPQVRVLGERIRYSEVELKDTTPEAFRIFVQKLNVFEKECNVGWDRSLIHKDVTGFLDLRWRHFVALQNHPDLKSNSWMNVFPEKFEEFILWVADVVERETNIGGSAVDVAMNAIQQNTVELDAMTGGIKLELQWSKLKNSLNSIDVKNLSRVEFEGLKSQILNSVIPKDCRVEANNFIRNLYGLGPGRYKYISDLPYNFEWIDWYLPMIAESNRIQKLGMEVRKAEGSGLEFIGYSRTSSGGQTKSEPSRIMHHVQEEYIDQNEGRGPGHPDRGYSRQENGPSNNYNDRGYKRQDGNTGHHTGAYNSPGIKNNGGRQSTPQGSNMGTPNNVMSKYIPFSTGSRGIQREGYTPWMKPAGRYDDGKEYFLCQACGIIKSFHRPEFCPALKTNSRYANGLWREVSWDASPGAELCKREYPGLTYAPKNDERGNPMLPTWYTEKYNLGPRKGEGGGSRQSHTDKGNEGSRGEQHRREGQAPASGHKQGNPMRGGGASPHSIYEPPPFGQSRSSGQSINTSDRQSDKDLSRNRSTDNGADNQREGARGEGTVSAVRQLNNNEIVAINDWVLSEINNMNPSEKGLVSP
jgi:hypothetical protein